MYQFKSRIKQINLSKVDAGATFNGAIPWIGGWMDEDSEMGRIGTMSGEEETGVWPDSLALRRLTRSS